MKRRTILACAPLLLLSGLLHAQNGESKTGILLLAHGGRLATWNEEVNRIAASANEKNPTEVAFGMATKQAIQSAIDRLTARGVKEIVAVPLFVSSYSSVITSTEWLLGLRPEMPEDYKDFAAMSHAHGAHGAPAAAGHEQHAAAVDPMTPVKSSVPIRMTPALNRHPIVADILYDRAKAISKNPEEEVLILVAHGPNPDDDNRKWLADMEALAALMKPRTTYHRIEFLTVRDDAPEPTASEARAELRGKVERAVNEKKTVLIVPLLLSYGGVEGRIKKRLEGLDYTMATQGLLPDPRIVDWVRSSVGTATAASR